MDFDKLVNRLIWDTDLITLRQYADGTKEIPLKSEIEVKAIKNMLPRLIRQHEVDNIEFMEQFVNSKLTNLAIYKLHKDNARKGKKFFHFNEVVTTMYDIINTAGGAMGGRGNRGSDSNVSEMLHDYMKGD